MNPVVARYCIAKDGRLHGREVWGVYDLTTKKIVEGCLPKEVAKQMAKAKNKEASK